MPGTNLTRDEAQQRAALLSVDSYEIDLDLSGAQEGGTYRSVTTVRFDVAENGATSFIDLVAPTVHEVTLNGDALDPAEVFADSRIALPGLLQGRVMTKLVVPGLLGRGEHDAPLPLPTLHPVHWAAYRPEEGRRKAIVRQVAGLRQGAAGRGSAPGGGTPARGTRPTARPARCRDAACAG